MLLVDYLDKGASLGADRPCLTCGDDSWSYQDVRGLSWRVAKALDRSGIRPGEKVAIISSNDPMAFACVFGISRAGAVWCGINPRNEAEENRETLDLFDCTCVIFKSAYAPMVAEIMPKLSKVTTLVCLDGAEAGAIPFEEWLADLDEQPWSVSPIGDTAMLVGTGGTTGRPKGVPLSERNMETLSAITLMSYPFTGRPVYLALAPLTHAAGTLCFPVLALGGEIVVMPKPDLDVFLESVPRYKITHTFLPPTLIYMLLGKPELESADLSSLQCLWYGAAPMSATRLEEAINKIGPVMAQFFGQTEAPMMASTMSPQDHFLADGSIARERLSSAGKPAPLVQLAIMDKDGNMLPTGERGEIVLRGSLVMAGYYKNPEATREASQFGWHHTGDIGYLDEDNFLFIVDRAKDMIISGGFNVYSAEVEQALLAHSAVQDCGVIGLPDDKWGERVTAVIQLHQGQDVSAEELREFVKSRIGSVKAPKQYEFWADLPRSKVGKVLKNEVKSQLLNPTK